MPPTEFYHGTSFRAAVQIQRNGFDVSFSKPQCILGPGLYITTSLEKALHYAKCKTNGGVVFKLFVDVGNSYCIESATDSLIKTWHSAGFDPRAAKPLHVYICSEINFSPLQV